MGAALGVGEGVDGVVLEEIVGMGGSAEGTVEVTEQGFAMELIKRFDFGHGPSVHLRVALVGSHCRYRRTRQMENSSKVNHDGRCRLESPHPQ